MMGVRKKIKEPKSELKFMFNYWEIITFLKRQDIF